MKLQRKNPKTSTIVFILINCLTTLSESVHLFPYNLDTVGATTQLVHRGLITMETGGTAGQMLHSSNDSIFLGHLNLSNHVTFWTQQVDNVECSLSR